MQKRETLNARMTLRSDLVEFKVFIVKPECLILITKLILSKCTGQQRDVAQSFLILTAPLAFLDTSIGHKVVYIEF